MVLLAAGCLPRRRRGPHTGGAPHPENLQRGNPLPTACGWLEDVFGREAADSARNWRSCSPSPRRPKSSARVPAAERVLRPLRRLLGTGPYDVILNRPIPASIRPMDWSAPASGRCRAPGARPT